jgi:hypothetical protein
MRAPSSIIIQLLLSIYLNHGRAVTSRLQHPIIINPYLVQNLLSKIDAEKIFRKISYRVHVS